MKSASGIEVAISDSITQIDRQLCGAVVISGSHGAPSAGAYALSAGVRGVIFNDAAVGKNEAGIRGLDTLDEFLIMAAAVSSMTARIGDGADTLDSGVISFANTSARVVGISRGCLRAKPLSEWQI